jgi:predicted nuclease of predicted toxin-antitoxin system
VRLFADENVADPIVAWLRGRGHDIVHAREIDPGRGDERWLAEADAEGRVILTSDKDFGDPVFRDRLASHGIILLRLDPMTIRERIARLTAAWPELERAGPGKFLVVTPTKVRSRELGDP